MRTKDRGQEKGRAELVLARYQKLRGVKILPTTFLWWTQFHLFDDCIYKKTKSGRKIYYVPKAIKRIDTIRLLKDARLSLAEIRRTIERRLEEEKNADI